METELAEDVAGEPRRRAERTLLMLWLTVRGAELVQGTLTTVAGWKAYRRPWRAALLLALSYAETAALARLVWQRKSYQHAGLAWADTAFGVAGLVAMAGAAPLEERTSFLNWMCPMCYSCTLGAAIAFPDTDDKLLATGLLAGTYAATVAPNFALGGGQLATAAANVVNFGAFLTAGGSLATSLRRTAADLDAAHRRSLEQERRLASARERDRQHRVLHDSALQTLEAVARAEAGSDGPIRAQAARDAVRLRHALIADSRTRPSALSEALAEVVEEAAAWGLRVEFVAAELDDDPAAESVEALADATEEALRNVVKHAHTPRAVLRAAPARGGVEVTVRDQGAGFDAQVCPPGSIAARLAEVGGTAQWTSTPGSGTRVNMWVPL